MLIAICVFGTCQLSYVFFTVVNCHLCFWRLSIAISVFDTGQLPFVILTPVYCHLCFWHLSIAISVFNNCQLLFTFLTLVKSYLCFGHSSIAICVFDTCQFEFIIVRYLTRYAYIYFTGLLNRFKCNFNSGNTCDLNQDSNDVFDWTVQQGDTPSVSTGPNRDRGTGSEGYYIYIETSDPRVGVYCATCL